MADNWEFCQIDHCEIKNKQAFVISASSRIARCEEVILSIMIGQSKCLQATNVYFSRAVGYYLQRNGIPVIPNVRWGEESTYSFAFSGIPKHSIVAIGSNGCMAKDKSNASIVRETFKEGLPAMLKAIEPEAVVVYGRMPEDIFGSYLSTVRFVRFPSESELAHEGENKHGI
jgi:hypothetical protein